MVAEILICAAIAFAIILGFGLITAFCIWLDDNTNIDVGICVVVIVSFIALTYAVWSVRNNIGESKEAKLKRRRIQYRGVTRRMILYEQYCGNERNDARTKIFKNEEEMLNYLQDNKGYLLGKPLNHRWYKIIITMLGDEK